MKNIATIILCCLALTGCEILVEPSNKAPNVDGSYLGDFGAKILYYVNVSGGLQPRETTLSGAVGFTIQGTRVITNPAFAREGVAQWDHVNRYWWIDFESIYSASAQYCHKFKYSGILREADNYIRAEGTITCLQRDDFVQPITGNWYAKRQ